MMDYLALVIKGIIIPFITLMLGALSLLLLLLKSETAIILGIVFALAGGIINIGVFCILLHGEIYSRQQ